MTKYNMFKLRDRCKDFFSEIRSQTELRTDFDTYYLCAMIGLLQCERTDPNSYGDNVNVFTDNFTKEYNETRYTIIALMVCAEAKKRGIDLDEKSSMVRLFEEMTDPNTQSRLSTAGAEALNAYASGGFDVINKHFDEKPRSLPNFLIRYKELLK